jgi:hypothetical protein
MAIDPRALLCMKPFDATAWAQVVAEDCHARIGNAPPAVGRNAVLKVLVALYAPIEGFGSDYFDSWTRREAVFIETDLAFRAGAAGRIDRIPCVAIMRVTRNLLRDFRLLLDPAPIPNWSLDTPDEGR